MRTSVILIVGCCVVLGGAFFASRALVSEVPVPTTAPVGMKTIVVAPSEVGAANPAPTPAPGPPADSAAHQAMLAPHQGLLQPVNVNAAPGYPRALEPAAPPADVATSPFKGESKELDYAERLLADPTPDPEKLQSAHEVMSRCAEQEPDNKRCQDGLALARRLLLSGAGTTQLKPAAPTLQTDPPHRPALHPK